ncbi:MAG: hypothetical protein SGI99_13580 [Pseudomonadota bacterium]|nr:hypothetical protein [Pseudomonadota bacterium]
MSANFGILVALALLAPVNEVPGDEFIRRAITSSRAAAFAAQNSQSDITITQLRTVPPADLESVKADDAVQCVVHSIRRQGGFMRWEYGACLEQARVIMAWNRVRWGIQNPEDGRFTIERDLPLGQPLDCLGFFDCSSERTITGPDGMAGLLERTELLDFHSDGVTATLKLSHGAGQSLVSLQLGAVRHELQKLVMTIYDAFPSDSDRKVVGKIEFEVLEWQTIGDGIPLPTKAFIRYFTLYVAPPRIVPPQVVTYLVVRDGWELLSAAPTRMDLLAFELAPSEGADVNDRCLVAEYRVGGNVIKIDGVSRPWVGPLSPATLRAKLIADQFGDDLNVESGPRPVVRVASAVGGAASAVSLAWVARLSRRGLRVGR